MYFHIHIFLYYEKTQFYIFLEIFILSLSFVTYFESRKIQLRSILLNVINVYLRSITKRRLFAET